MPGELDALRLHNRIAYRLEFESREHAMSRSHLSSPKVAAHLQWSGALHGQHDPLERIHP